MRADRELSPALLDTLFEEGPFGLAFFDRELRYVRVSERLARFTGLPREALIGHAPEEVVPDLAADIRANVGHTLRRGEAMSFEITGETSAQPGLRRSFVTTYYPVREDGEVVGVVAIVIDVTAERRVEAQRAQLYELERQARGRAETAERRAHFLAEAAELLDSSLDLKTTLRTLSRVLVPRVADLCLIDMVDLGGQVRRLAVAHRDEAVEQAVWQLTHAYPSAPGTALGIRRAVEMGTTEYIPEITPRVLERAFPNPAHRAQVAAMGLRSAVVVPLSARGRTLGALTLVLTDSGRTFHEPDVALADELARRASLAVDNARLYTDLRRADRAQRFLSEATQILSSSSLDWDETVETIARLVVNGMADGCSIDVVEPSGDIHLTAMAHIDPAKRDVYLEIRRRFGVGSRSPFLRRAAETMQPALHAEVRAADRAEAADDPEHQRLIEAYGARSVITVPMIARDHPVGLISMHITDSDRRFDDDDLALADELGRRAGVAADNARLYSERTHVARTLQRSLIPAKIPPIPGMEIAVRFRSAGEGEVGGDFYDVFEQAPGSWAAVVGDVCGKGAQAAALTALARHTVRAAARYEDGPIGVLARLNQAIPEQAPELMFCTAALLWLTPGSSGTDVRVALGGHLPPLVVRAAGGRVEPVEAAGALLGVFDEPDLEERGVRLEPGDALVVYTDGVTEAGAPDNSLGEEALAEALSELAGHGAEQIADAVEQLAQGRLADGPRDDIAILVIRHRP